jgi:protease-4
MRRSLLGLLALVIVAVVALAVWAARTRVAEHSVLVVELEGELEEQPPGDFLSQLQARGPALPTLLLLLDMAAADARVDGVLLHVKPTKIGYARMQELRDALAHLRGAGKRVVALLDGDSLNATRELFLASAADKVFVDEGSLTPFAGIAAQYLQLGGFFDKIGVRWEYSRVGKYKSAVEQFAAREMSPAAREMTTAIVDGIFGQLVDGIASGRKLSGERVRALIGEAPATPEELIAGGLVDGVANRKSVLEKAGLKDAPELEAEKYQRLDPRSIGVRRGPKIALIFGDGTVVDERGRSLSAQFAADEVEKALDAAASDDSIKAVVLRINSPGGSSHASEVLWRAVRRVHEKKPVVVSMADYAASGGYYIASAANAIVAEPATLTGSIGVFLMRPAAEELYKKLEIGREVIARGPYAEIAGADGRLTPAQQTRLDAWTLSFYHVFTGRVSEGRGLSVEDVDKVGQGHVWLGSDALAHNLVDELGGLATAVARARREAHIEDQPDPVRVILPASRGPLEQLRDVLHGDASARLLRAALPIELPALPGLDGAPVGGALAYLPPYWLELR